MYYKSEKGLALPLVIVVIAILLIILTSVIYVISNQTVAIDRTKTSEQALHIAEAGYNRYIWQLNDNSDFYKWTESVDEFEPVEFYSGTEAGAISEWAGYPKKYKASEYISGGRAVGYYQIEVVPPTTAKPVVTIKSTGWINGNESIKRAVEVKVHKRQFTNYMEFASDMTDVEGNNIFWGNGEQVRGPFFTNGWFRTSGTPVFHDNVTYCEGWDRISGYPEFMKPGQPVKGTPMVFPSSNSNIVHWAEAGNGGYEYSGRTSILLNRNQLKIRNVNKNNDEIVTRPLPSSGVIYVDGTLFVSGVLDGRLSIVTEGNIYITGKDPTDFDYDSAAVTGGITYANVNIPTSASASLSGQSDDMLGLISSGNILVNSQYWPRENSSTHQNIFNRFLNSNVKDIRIHGAIFGLTANSYFGVDRYGDLGDMGFIYFTGSKITNKVAATYRTSAGWWGSVNIHGYKEDNSFDYRMTYDTPPHFLEPTNTGWEIKEWAEVPVAQ